MIQLPTVVQTRCFTREELDTADYAEAELAKARFDLQIAESKGFMHCLAVFVRDEYDGLWVKAHPTDGHFDWGRGSKMIERFYFRDGAVVPDEAWPGVAREAEWEAHGLRCHTIMTDLGHRCGYVGVPAGHPWFGIGYDDCTLGDSCEVAAKQAAEPDGWFSHYEHSPGGLTNVHGGLTYADRGRDDWWYFGFDCAHAGDLAAPEYIQREVERYGHSFMRDRDGHHWTKDEVVAETNRLAEQLAARGTTETTGRRSDFEPTMNDVVQFPDGHLEDVVGVDVSSNLDLVQTVYHSDPFPVHLHDEANGVTRILRASDEEYA